MTFYALAVIFAIAYVVTVDGQVEFPAGVKTCKRDSADYSSCLRLAIQESWPTFVKGIPEIDLPPLDPFFIEMDEATFSHGEMQGKIIVKNMNSYGMAKARFLAVRPFYDGQDFRLEIDLELPKIFIEGDYKADASVGRLKIGGKGYFNVSMEDIRVTWKLEGPVVDDRWKVEHFTAMPEIGKMKVYFSDLFYGNEELTKAALTFINEYWPFLYRGMLPMMSDLWDKSFTQFVNGIFSKVSFSKSFP